MKLSSITAKSLLAVTLVVAVWATQVATALAVESVFLGQAGKLGLSGTCSDCSVAQIGDTGAAGGVPQSGPYKAPFSGVLTYFSYRAGEEITTSPADTVRPQAFSLAGSTAFVNHEGASHVIEPWPGAPPGGGGLRYFRDRVPIAAGEVLGGRFTVKSIAISGDPTPQFFETTEAGDTVRIGKPGASLGGAFTGTTESKFRVNLLATLEPDADADGYGDVSQDLCLGSPVGEGACSGSLFGSHLQREVEFGGSCSLECLLFQKTIGGVSQAAPFDGVVVRWRVLDADSGSYRVRTVSAPLPGERYITGPSSAVESLVAAAPPRLLKKQISTFQTRIPIEAGGYVGLVYQPSPSIHIQKGVGATGATYQVIDNAVPDGTNAGGLLSPSSGELLYDADIEPDADHDGYGDISQDSCPGDAAVHSGGCPQSAPPSPRAFPTITGLEVVPKRFRVKRGGAVVSKKGIPAGTKFKLNLSEAATVAFSIAAKPPCKAPKGAAKCPPPVTIHTFKRALPAGPSAVPYSGRYRKGRRIRTLSPGGYQLVASPSGNGRSGGSRSAFFVVAP